MKNYSIAKFGSQLRSHFDKYSDKDLLVVAETIEELITLHKKYTKEGWSVSSYTYSKLEFLSQKGSLFISHLSNESEILIDSNSRFRNILDKHIHKCDFKQDLEDSRIYFKILDTIPDLSLGYAWFSDCVYVGLRNYLVFEYANKGVYEFSYLKLIERLYFENKIDNKELFILRQLRILKYNYRENILDELPSKHFAIKLITILKKLSLTSDIKIEPSYKFENNTLRIVTNSKFNGYQRLRLIEGLYCSKGINNPEIKKIISNPQFYACKLVDNNYLNNIIDTLEANPFKEYFGKSINVFRHTGYKSAQK